MTNSEIAPGTKVECFGADRYVTGKVLAPEFGTVDDESVVVGYLVDVPGNRFGRVIRREHLRVIA